MNRGLYAPAELTAAARYVFGVDTRLIEDGTYHVVELGGERASCGGWSRRRTLYGAIGGPDTGGGNSSSTCGGGGGGD